MGGSQTWINFKYKHLIILYYLYGIIGHEVRFCPNRFMPYYGRFFGNFPYGEWLRAQDFLSKYIHGRTKGNIRSDDVGHLLEKRVDEGGRWKRK